jgi:hypothetical protein
MREDAAFGHLSMLGQLTDRQPLKTLLRRNLQRRIDDTGTGLFPFTQLTQSPQSPEAEPFFAIYSTSNVEKNTNGRTIFEF